MLDTIRVIDIGCWLSNIYNLLTMKKRDKGTKGQRTRDNNSTTMITMQQQKKLLLWLWFLWLLLWLKQQKQQ